MDAMEALEGIADRSRTGFSSERRILSFEDWLILFLDSPNLLGRSAPQYVLDMFDHFGTTEVETARGLVQRFRVFDLEFLDGEGRVHGQESVQEAVYQCLRAAADGGRTERLSLLHGPNGSGKSVIVEAIFRGLEHYSRTPEGALYRFNWVFPRVSSESGGLGFHTRASGGAKESGSFAGLVGEDLSARLRCELKDHPLFLVPRADRGAILEAALARRPEDRGRSFRWLLDSDLCQKCKGIYEGLLAAYQGDWMQLARHVQVERLYISQRYRTGAVTILPMGNVDAQEQQTTADASTQNLPPVLKNLKIFEPFGDLVDANCGVVEYGDFLKRPMDLNKYLLNAVEKGTISLPNTLVHLNLVMMGTSNEKHLDAFKATPEFTSFKGRIELAPVPYLLEFRREARMYEDLLRTIPGDIHIAPHSLELAALWAVLTRLFPADPAGLEGRLGEIAAALTPVEKAYLYDRHLAPERLDRNDRRVLLSGARKVRDQHRNKIVYEGRFGASAREMRVVLSAAAYDRRHPCLTPELVFAAIRDLIRDETVYDFLQLKPRSGYHEADAFVEQVAGIYSTLVLEDMQDAMQLIREDEYDKRFEEYLQHTVAFIRGERIKNPQTGTYEPPSDRVLKSVEDLLDTGDDREAFRKDLVGRIGAFALDHPKERVRFRKLFPDLLSALKREFYDQRRGLVQGLLRNLLTRDAEDGPELSGADRDAADSALTRLVEQRGYCAECAGAAAAWLLSHYPE